MKGNPGGMTVRWCAASVPDSLATMEISWLTVGHLDTIVMLSLFRNLLCQLCADFGSLNPSAIYLLIDAVPIR